MDRASIVQAVRQPKSAAIAGLVFAVLLIAAILLFRTVTPPSLSESSSWIEDPQSRQNVSLALQLLPFAGIAFLWFIAVVRSQLGDREDRFFETVFLGSGLIFVAVMFVSAAALGAVLRLTEDTDVAPGVSAYVWVFGQTLLGQFGMRMAAVFTISITTAGLRIGTVPRWLVASGLLVGVLLLLTPPVPNLSQFLFPAWVGLLSAFILVGRKGRRRVPAQDSQSTESGTET